MDKFDLPLADIICDGGMMNIFRSIGCIGDSLSSGEFEYDNQGEKGYWDCYEYSWGKQIERITGIEMTNFSRGGLTAFQLYTEADAGTSPVEDINSLFSPSHVKQAYIIALGVNDLKGKDVLKKYITERWEMQRQISTRRIIMVIGTLLPDGMLRSFSVCSLYSLMPNFFSLPCQRRMAVRKILCR